MFVFATCYPELRRGGKTNGDCLVVKGGSGTGFGSVGVLRLARVAVAQRKKDLFCKKYVSAGQAVTMQPASCRGAGVIQVFPDFVLEM